MENKNKGLMICFIISILLVIGLSGYIVYDKVIKKDTSTEAKETNKQGTDESNKDKQGNNDNTEVQPKDIKYVNLSIGSDGCVKTDFNLYVNISGIKMNNSDYTLKYEHSNSDEDKYYLNDKLFYAIKHDMDLYQACNFNNYLILTEAFLSGTPNNLIVDQYGNIKYKFLGRFDYRNNILDIYQMDSFIDNEDTDNETAKETHYKVDLSSSLFEVKKA